MRVTQHFVAKGELQKRKLATEWSILISRKQQRTVFRTEQTVAKLPPPIPASGWRPSSLACLNKSIASSLPMHSATNACRHGNKLTTLSKCTEKRKQFPRKATVPDQSSYSGTTAPDSVQLWKLCERVRLASEPSTSHRGCSTRRSCSVRAWSIWWTRAGPTTSSASKLSPLSRNVRLLNKKADFLS